MSFATTNPFTLQPISSYPAQTPESIRQQVEACAEAQKKWRKLSFSERAVPIQKLAKVLLHNKEEAALLMAEEMGKPFQQGVAEVEKCAWCCEHYATHAKSYLQSSTIDLDDGVGKIVYQPLGVLLGIMPWNFPFWQVIRFGVPALMGGNTVLLKHAPNVYGCAALLQKICIEAGIHENCYSNIQMKTADVAELIANPIIKGITLTGSVAAGEAVGAEAGKHIKPMVLELGGSNPFIVFPDADMDTVMAAAEQKLQNAGQSCIAPKRFIIHHEVYETFIDRLLKVVNKYAPSNPTDTDCTMGPLARLDLAEKLEQQVKDSLAQGATALVPFKREGACVWPAILSEVTPHMTAFSEELFGPVYAITTFAETEEAFTIANQGEFGLGASIFTQNKGIMENAIEELEEGAVFVNSVVKSDPRLPFGGVKKSGVGRELAAQGIQAFQNVKTVRIPK